MIDGDFDRIWGRDDLCSSEDSLFIGSGVCSGRTKGVEELENGQYSVNSEIIDVKSHSHDFVTSIR